MGVSKSFNSSTTVCSVGDQCAIYIATQRAPYLVSIGCSLGEPNRYSIIKNDYKWESLQRISFSNKILFLVTRMRPINTLAKEQIGRSGVIKIYFFITGFPDSTTPCATFTFGDIKGSVCKQPYYHTIWMSIKLVITAAVVKT